VAKPQSLPDQLRAAVAARGFTAYELGKLSGVDKAAISRFLKGERDLTLTSAGRIAAAMGLRLVEVAGRRR
jgi:transcriptional regulator with XRE-family HTH domain